MTILWVWISILSYFLFLESCSNVDAECDIEALRCDVICFFPHLIHHCSACGIRRPMRFGKRDPISSKEDSILHLTERFLDGSGAVNLGTDTPNLWKKLYKSPEEPFVWSSNAFKSASLNEVPIFHRGQHHPIGSSRHHRKRFYGATTSSKDSFGKTMRATNRPLTTRIGPIPFDILNIYESMKLSELKTRQFKRNLAFLTSKELNTKELISGIKGVMQMKNLPVDPIDYGCHNYF